MLPLTLRNGKIETKNYLILNSISHLSYSTDKKQGSALKKLFLLVSWDMIYSRLNSPAKLHECNLIKTSSLSTAGKAANRFIKGQILISPEVG